MPIQSCEHSPQSHEKPKIFFQIVQDPSRRYSLRNALADLTGIGTSYQPRRRPSAGSSM